MKRFVLLLLLLVNSAAMAQFSPQVGLPGCDAIADTSTKIVAWATDCTLYRGYMCIDTPGLGITSIGDRNAAIGPSDQIVVSLGDSGVAIVTFQQYVFDAPGPDFAVFENGFANPGNDSQAFLELAFVAVSSDGIHYFTFPPVSNTPVNVQVRGSGDYMYANKIHNLAGKYVAGFGTPFDLAELAGTPGLDINHVTHVRITDVVGSVNSFHGTKDKNGNKINDPFPTNFPSGGFDLDAVAAIHHPPVSGVSDIKKNTLQVFPNPATDRIFIEGPETLLNGTITDIAGRVVATVADVNSGLDISALQAGTYFGNFKTNSGRVCQTTFTKY